MNGLLSFYAEKEAFLFHGGYVNLLMKKVISGLKVYG